jgi:hypothetical protein
VFTQFHNECAGPSRLSTCAGGVSTCRVGTARRWTSARQFLTRYPAYRLGATQVLFCWENTNTTARNFADAERQFGNWSTNIPATAGR